MEDLLKHIREWNPPEPDNRTYQNAPALQRYLVRQNNIPSIPMAEDLTFGILRMYAGVDDGALSVLQQAALKDPDTFYSTAKILLADWRKNISHVPFAERRKPSNPAVKRIKQVYDALLKVLEGHTQHPANELVQAAYKNMQRVLTSLEAARAKSPLEKTVAEKPALSPREVMAKDPNFEAIDQDKEIGPHHYVLTEDERNSGLTGIVSRTFSSEKAGLYWSGDRNCFAEISYVLERFAGYDNVVLEVLKEASTPQKLHLTLIKLHGILERLKNTTKAFYAFTHDVHTIGDDYVHKIDDAKKAVQKILDELMRGKCAELEVTSLPEGPAHASQPVSP